MILDKKTLGLFVIFILCSSIGAVGDFYSSPDNSGSSAIISENNSKIDDSKKDFRIVNKDLKSDIDGDKIQDSFESRLESLNYGEKIDAVLSFTYEITDSDLYYLESLGIDVVKQYSVIYGLHVRGTAESLRQASKLSSTVYMEENALGHSLMYNATEVFAVRTAWQASTGYGYTGNPNTAIAVLDTGIDDSHADANFNVVYWQDFEGVNYTVAGDEYATPIDKGEHGTHCASIAVGKGALFNNDTFKIQDSGFLPITAGNSFFGTWFYVEQAQTVTINYAWEGTGTAYVGILDSTISWVSNNYGSAPSSSPASYQVSLPSAGWYCPMYGNELGSGDEFYSGEVVYDSDWTNPYGDSYGPFAGVAPDSNIVGLKVLDDNGVGSTTGLLAALDWLYENGTDYDVTVASLSLGWAGIVSSIDSAISSLVRNVGIVCVVAAGNSGTSSGGIFSPASSPDCIAVGAVNNAHEVTYYSSIGDASQTYLRPDVVAPGGSFASSGSSAPDQPIFAADSNDADDAFNYNNYTQLAPRTDHFANNFRGLQGTSMACPFVAGLAQLVIDTMIEEGTWDYSWETAKKVKQIICMGTFEAKNLEDTLGTGGESYDGDSDGTAQLTDLNRISKDYTEGWGCVEPLAAVQAVTEWMDVGIEETVTLTGRQKGSHVQIRQVELDSGELYYLHSKYSISTWVDGDVLIFDTDPDQYGDPLLLEHHSLSVVANQTSIFTVPDDDVYYVVIRWVDGNYDGQCRVLIEELIDDVTPEDGSVIKEGDTISFDIDDTGVKKMMYKWDYGTKVDWTSPYDIPLPWGDWDHFLIVYAVDWLDQESQVNFTFIGDNVNPEISLISPSDNSIVNVSDTITVNVTDIHLETVLYHWDTNSDTAWAAPYTTSVPSGAGIHTLYVYAEDEAGNSASDSFSFEVEETPPDPSEPTKTGRINGFLLFTALGSFVTIVIIRRKKS